MSDVLALQQRPVVAQFARSNVLVAFDFDGTLAPIVAHPNDAGIAPDTRALLQRIAKLYPTAIISGRRRIDVRKLLHGTGIRHIVGNHGADLIPEAAESRRLVKRWAARLTKELAGLEGVWVENKGLSLTVHYRNSPNRRRMRRCAYAAAQSLTGARVAGAKAAVNVVLPSVPDKGEALAILQSQLSCERMIFVGDDVTDEDVFTREWGDALLGVSVGRRKSAAPYKLREQSQIDRFLQMLAEFREPSD